MILLIFFFSSRPRCSYCYPGVLSALHWTRASPEGSLRTLGSRNRCLKSCRRLLAEGVSLSLAIFITGRRIQRRSEKSRFGDSTANLIGRQNSLTRNPLFVYWRRSLAFGSTSSMLMLISIDVARANPKVYTCALFLSTRSCHPLTAVSVTECV